MAYKKNERSRTFLKMAKDRYEYYFNSETYEFSRDKAMLRLGELSDTDLRIDFIKKVYETIFESNRINDITKEWIKRNGSIDTVIEQFNVEQKRRNKRLDPDKAQSSIRNDLYRLRHEMSVVYGTKGATRNVFEIIEEFNDLNEEDWENCNNALASFGNKSGKRSFDKLELLINLSTKVFSKTCEDNKFIDFLKVIAPYGSKERRNIQDIINSEYEVECGYFNFIMGDNAKLNDHENEYRSLIEKWLDGNGMNLNDLTFYKESKKEKETIIVENEDTVEENNGEESKIEESLINREIDLDLKEERLNDKEKELEEREIKAKEQEEKNKVNASKVNDRAALLNGVKKDLDQREKDLDEREERIRQKEKELGLI